MAFLFFIIALLVVAIVVDKVTKQCAGTQPHRVTRSDAKEALDRMKDWATWLSGLQTGAIAAIGFLKESDLQEDWTALYHFCGIMSAGAFAASVFGLTWLLGSLPSIQQRLGVSRGSPHTDNDIYHQSLFVARPTLKLQWVAAFSHYFGIVGFLFLVLFFAIGMVSEHKEKESTRYEVTSRDHSIQFQIAPVKTLPGVSEKKRPSN